MAAKYALLIGIASYGEGVPPLPSVGRDVEAMREIFEDPALGDIPANHMAVLIDPRRTEMEQAIENFYLTKRAADDVLIFYYSGHGQLDPVNYTELLLSTGESQKISRDGSLYLESSTMLPASKVREYMDRSSSRCKVVILDCCHSGAFVQGMTADKVANTIRPDLINRSIRKAFDGVNGAGRAVLASSANIETSLVQDNDDGLSVYTNYIVEGIKTGKAAPHHDTENIKAKDLHDYVRKSVIQKYSNMTPQFFTTLGGAEIPVSKVFKDPGLQYRENLKKYIYRDGGEIISRVRSILDILRDKLGLAEEDAHRIEEEVRTIYNKHKSNEIKYRQAVKDLKSNHTENNKLYYLSRDELDDLSVLAFVD
jgi:branched-chain amino acid transport system substrate-binding protein